MKSKIVLLAASLILSLVAPGCESTPEKTEKRAYFYLPAETGSRIPRRAYIDEAGRTNILDSGSVKRSKPAPGSGMENNVSAGHPGL